MLLVIKRLLLQIIDDIDSGNSDITDEGATELVDILRRYTRKDEGLSKYQAVNYLGISRATFDNLIRDGKLIKGKKVVGFNELRWYKKDLDEYIKNNK